MPDAPLTHREKRVYFTRLACKLVTWINEHDWTSERTENFPTPEEWTHVECAMDEWTIHNPRLVKVGTERVVAQDVVHNPRGLHSQGLACDLLIYVNGDYITNGNHPIWTFIDRKARHMDPNFGLGMSFNDANHLSYGE